MEEEFLIFLDETGDHSLRHIDTEYPIFGLGAVICKTEWYIDKVNPMFDRFKYKFFNKRSVILHSTDIRNSRKDFSIMLNPKVRKSLIDDLNNTVDQAPFVFCASFIDKLEHKGQYVDPDNPYDLTLAFILERAFFIISKNFPGAKCRIIAESRDKKENDSLRKTFDAYKTHGTGQISASELNFITGLDFVSKKENETGHQIVDICLYPLARTYLKGKCHPSVPHFYKKIYKNPKNNSPIGWGIKTFPSSFSKDLVKEIEKNCI
ncbi:DUF3800 domain-containing protein [Bacillus sonorensis]|uniref:DUF3800 domain-containing protein n=1 Tax=Bacillus sonorensis TaxID=119858 RepID=UPI002DBBBD3C|nr:DUF3800 domain-containing protein [Bacillus sonorensis]MEC1427907.1 DUF3800 domain-containing protein [Bacillus sonorensis]